VFGSLEGRAKRGSSVTELRSDPLPAREKYLPQWNTVVENLSLRKWLCLTFTRKWPEGFTLVFRKFCWTFRIFLGSHYGSRRPSRVFSFYFTLFLLLHQTPRSSRDKAMRHVAPFVFVGSRRKRMRWTNDSHQLFLHAIHHLVIKNQRGNPSSTFSFRTFLSPRVPFSETKNFQWFLDPF
jgi:hypothetical protein